VCDHDGPVPAVDPADYQPPRLVGRAGRDLDPGDVLPQLLGLGEVDAVLFEIGRALGRVKLELYRTGSLQV
jgi:hypothetical protein